MLAGDRPIEDPLLVLIELGGPLGCISEPLPPLSDLKAREVSLSLSSSSFEDALNTVDKMCLSLLGDADAGDEGDDVAEEEEGEFGEKGDGAKDGDWVGDGVEKHTTSTSEPAPLLVL
mmetsp:Transcript_13522/g.27633  ORF Transcript_13522/g.27633 Transcript_13522/m.27633 type:complete len:118 (-) Transcript_13522:690-1043(-)